MFSTIVISFVFGVTTVLISIYTAGLFALRFNNADWVKYWCTFAIWFITGCYLFG